MVQIHLSFYQTRQMIKTTHCKGTRPKNLMNFLGEITYIVEINISQRRDRAFVILSGLLLYSVICRETTLQVG